MKLSKDILKNYIIAAVSISACAVVLSHSEGTAEAVRTGINMCFVSVIPSLFPMMFLAQYLVRSGAAEQIGGILETPARVLFGLPGACGAAVLTGMVGGYPSGAAAAEALVQRGAITRRQGERLANIAFCSGPGFTIGMVGAQLYKNKSVGLLILTAQVISCIIIGIVLKFVAGNSKSNAEFRTNPHYDLNRNERQNAFVESASAASSAVLAMCSFIIIFQVINYILTALEINGFTARVLQQVGLGHFGEYIFPCITEVTGGSMLSLNVGLPFTAFVVGFGGLSVHFQNFAVCHSIRVSKSRYIVTRLVQGGICSLIVSAALRIPFFADICVTTSTLVQTGVPVRFSNISGSFGVIMLLMCLMSVLCLPHSKGERYQNEAFKILRQEYKSRL